MVPKQINGRKTVKKLDTEPRALMVILLAILTASLTLVIYYFVMELKEESTSVPENITILEDEAGAQQSSEKTEVEIEKINFQPIIDKWVNSAGGNKSVLIYDLDRDEMAGEYNATEKYNTASLYKLFVVYEGYRRIENGEWQANDTAGGTGRTILECLDLAIRESNSECAETLWGMIGRDELEDIVKDDFGIKDTSVKSLISNPNDIMAMMKLFYEHPDIKDENLLARMWDSFLNQPKTTYNWRQGLPSGFSDKVNVYNKVGWDYNPDGKYWNIYHDAAIVEFPVEDRHFIVVVMTNKVPYQQILKLGTEIENNFYNN